MPLITCELRWFFEGAVPAEVERWFERGHAQPEPWREDRYLILPGVADMGIKAREGRLEIKGRTAELGRHVIAPAIEANAERWCKWSYGADLAERFGLRDHQAVIVGKQRTQRHFVMESGCRAQETAQRDLARRGVSLELTRIRVAGDHWSLGIEAAPDDATSLDDLLRALGDLLQGFPLPLPSARSGSYPSWLLDLAGAR